MIFITGCTGLVGSHLVAALVNSQQTSDNGLLTHIKLLCRKNSDLSLLKDVLKRHGINEMPDNIEFVLLDFRLAHFEFRCRIHELNLPHKVVHLASLPRELCEFWFHQNIA